MYDSDGEVRRGTPALHHKQRAHRHGASTLRANECSLRYSGGRNSVHYPPQQRQRYMHGMMDGEMMVESGEVEQLTFV